MQVKPEYTGILSNTEQEQIDAAKKLLDLPLEEGQSPAGKVQLIMDLLFVAPEPEEEP